MKRLLLRPLFILLVACLAGSTASAAELFLSANTNSPVIRMGTLRLAKALIAYGYQPKLLPAVGLAIGSDIRVITSAAEADAAGGESLGRMVRKLGPEDFRILWARVPSGGATMIIASTGERGAMYGLFDVAEQMELQGGLQYVQPRTVKARFPFRAIKYNLPWMSYRKGEALQQHIETCQDLDYWRKFLDMMVENRFNTLSLWNLHPFHFLIRPTNFPEACPWTDEEMAQLQQFWTELFQMAKDRGIDTYLVNWNIFVSPEFAKAHGKAGYSEDWGFFGPGDTSELVERYTRECVRQVLQEYPNLTGLGITLGERMGGMTADERRAWLDRTFIAGMREANRPARFIYRAPLSADKGSGGSVSVVNEQATRAQIERLDVTPPVLVEFKYNWSHGHSSTNLQIVHGGKLTDTYWNPAPKNYQVIWTVRNEDFFVLRWGQPDFIRSFIANNGAPYVGGCFIGSETYIPALDYISKDGSHKTWTYAFERQWMFYKMWGRLLYSPETPDSVFELELERRFGEGKGEPVLAAWKLASRTPLRIASFYQGTWDGSLYTEGFSKKAAKENRLELIDIDQLINHPVLDTNYISIADYVHGDSKLRRGKISPLKLADQCEEDTEEADKIASDVRYKTATTAALEAELADVDAWGWLSRYFAHKLRGGVALETFRARGKKRDQKKAIDELEQAVFCWQNLCTSVERYNNKVIPAVFDPEFSFRKHVGAVKKDVETAKAAKPTKK